MRQKKSLILLFLLLGVGRISAVEWDFPFPALDAVQFRDSLYAEAICLKQEEKYDAALVLLRQVDSLQQHQAAVWHEMGKIYLKKVQADSAQICLEEAVRLEPRNFYYLSDLAEHYEHTAQYAKAIDVTERIVRYFPAYDSYLQDLADLYVQTRQYRKALSMYDKIERRVGPSLQSGYQKISIYLEGMQSSKAALKELARMEERYSTDPTYWSLRGDVMQLLNRAEEAEEAYHEALKRESDNAYALESLMRLYGATRQNKQFLETMERYFASPKVETYRKLHYLPEHQEALEVSDLQRLNHFCRSALACDYNSSQLHLQLSSNWQLLHRPDSAYIEGKEAVRLDSASVAAWQNLVINCASEVDSVAWFQLCAQARESLPEHPLFYLIEGRMYWEMDRKEQAMPLLMQAVERLPNAQEKEQKEWAISAYLPISEYYFLQGKVDSAAIYMKRLLDQNPNNALIINNYYYYQAHRGVDLEEAERQMAKVVAKYPLEGSFLDTYAYILIRQKKIKEAKFYMEQAMHYTTYESSELYEHYGDVLLLGGDKEGAMQYWEKALSLENPSEVLKEKIRLQQYVE